jgi:hypothetical protein
VIAEVMRDVRRIADAVPAVEYPTIDATTDGSGVLPLVRVKIALARPRAVMVAACAVVDEPLTIPAAASVRWAYDGQLIVYGIGGLSASTHYQITLRVEGDR